jgi:hypothetical protein
MTFETLNAQNCAGQDIEGRRDDKAGDGGEVEGGRGESRIRVRRIRIIRRRRRIRQEENWIAFCLHTCPVQKSIWTSFQ